MVSAKPLRAMLTADPRLADLSASEIDAVVEIADGHAQEVLVVVVRTLAERATSIADHTMLTETADQLERTSRG
jgi:hypothetical protein